MKILPQVLSCLIVSQSVFVHAAEVSATTASLQQCAVDLCGPPAKYARITARGDFSRPDRDTKIFLQKEIQPRLKSIFQATIDNKKRAAAFTDEIVNGSDVSLTPKQKALLSVMTAISRLAEALPSVMTSADGRTFQIDREKLRLKKPAWSAGEVDATTEVLNAYFGTEAYASSQAVDGFNYDLFFNYLNMEGAEESTKFKSEILQEADLLYAELGPAFKGFVNRDHLAGLTKVATPTEAEKVLVMNTIIRMFRLSALTDPAVIKATAARPLDLKAVATALEWSGRRELLDFQLSIPDLVLQQKVDVQRVCDTTISRSLAATPSALRQRKADELLAKVKKAAQTVAPKYFSGTALAAASRAITTMKFTQPKNLEAAKKLHQDTLQEMRSQLQISESVLTEAAKNAAVKKSVAVLTLLQTSQGQGLFDEIESKCKDLDAPHFVDAAFTPLNTIMTGWQSTMFPEIGVGVLSHELGHIISAAVRKTQEGTGSYNRTRMCSIEAHARLAKSDLLSKFAQFAEEDWADAFAATTLKEIAKTWPYTENFTCALLPVDSTAQNFQGLQLTDPRGVSVHSESFLRVLQTQVSLGKNLPASCEQSLSALEIAVVARSCAQ